MQQATVIERESWNQTISHLSGHQRKLYQRVWPVVRGLLWRSRRYLQIYVLLQLVVVISVIAHKPVYGAGDCPPLKLLGIDRPLVSMFRSPTRTTSMDSRSLDKTYSQAWLLHIIRLRIYSVETAYGGASTQITKWMFDYNILITLISLPRHIVHHTAIFKKYMKWFII